MAICVFFCHVFEPFNEFGFLFVSVFFFISGYGLETSNKRQTCLTRVIPLLFLLAWFTAIYGLVFRSFLFPSAWYLYVYFVLMVIYRICPGLTSLWLAVYGLAIVFYVLDFNWVWWASMGSFVFGVFYAMVPRYFTLPKVLLWLPLVMTISFWPMFMWGFLPLFAWIIFRISSISFLRPLSYFSSYTKYFYLSHCFCLGLVGATWTLGGQPSLIPCLIAFVLACLFSIFLKDYLFSYPKVVK